MNASAITTGQDPLAGARAAVVAAVVTLVVGVATMTPDLIGVFFDDAIYVLVGKAIAEGQGYVYPQLPGTPPAIHYPPVWPGVIALVWRLGPEFPGNIVLLKLLNPVFLALAAAGGVVVARRHFALPSWAAVLAVVAATASVPMHVLTNVLLSEPLFLALLFPTILVTERLRADGGTRWALAAAALAAVLVLTRTLGGVVVVATLMVLAADRRWREGAVYLGVVALLLLPWQYFVWKHSAGFPDELRGSYGPYLQWVTDGYREGGFALLRDVVMKNVADAWRFVGAFLTPRVTGVARQAVTLVAIGFFVAGVWRGWGRPATRILTLAFVGYIGVTLAWPFQVDRFLWAVWPLFLLVALDGVRGSVRALRSAARPRAAWAVVAAGALLVIGHTAYNVRGFARGWASSASRQMSERSARAVQYANADPRLVGKVIGTEAAPMVALYTGLQVIPVEMLIVRDHLEKKSDQRSAEIIAALDRRFAPDAYVFSPNGPHLRAFLAAPFDSTRRFVEITPPGSDVRSFHAVPR
ncbi:MAG: hypothetical protein WD771_04570 [Gemmatimonadaceae bacterium]